MPVSVSLAGTFDREPEHTSSENPEEVIQCGVWEALERRAAANRKKMTDRSLKDFEFLSGQQQKLIKQWCFPVLGFKVARYSFSRPIPPKFD